jgi:hypothetical protein
VSEPRLVDFTPKDEQAMKALVNLLERNADDFARLAALMARVRRAYFTALVEQGFREEQALFLCSQGGTPLDYTLGQKA